jgi:hypothetical protein
MVTEMKVLTVGEAYEKLNGFQMFLAPPATMLVTLPPQILNVSRLRLHAALCAICSAAYETEDALK